MHDEVEIVFVKKGSVKAYIDGSSYVLENGCCIVTFPNQLHSYIDIEKSPDLVNYIMIFKSDVLKSFSAEFDKSVPERAIITDKEVLSQVEKLFEDAYKLNNQNVEYKFQALNAYATLILQQLLPFFTFKKVRKLQKDVSADVFAYCNQNFREDVSLENMAEEINISKEHIMRIFRERFHTNFRAYINRMRIDEAKKLLRTTDLSITEIAISIGFNTIRTFNRVFISLENTTPTEYRQLR